MVLPKKNRIKKKKEFELIFKKGELVKGKLLKMWILTNRFKKNRFAIIVSSKITKSAVLRNKLKRRISEIARLNLNNLKQGWDIIFLPFSTALKASFQDLENEIVTLLEKTKLLKK